MGRVRPPRLGVRGGHMSADGRFGAAALGLTSRGGNPGRHTPTEDRSAEAPTPRPRSARGYPLAKRAGRARMMAPIATSPLRRVQVSPGAIRHQRAARVGEARREPRARQRARPTFLACSARVSTRSRWPTEVTCEPMFGGFWLNVSRRLALSAPGWPSNWPAEVLSSIIARAMDGGDSATPTRASSSATTRPSTAGRW